MKKNVGNVDRWVRIVFGVALLSLVFILQGGVRWVGLLGIILILTGIIRVCPLYMPFKINTKKEN